MGKLTNLVEETNKKFKKIGIVGFSDDNFIKDKDEATKLLKKGFEKFGVEEGDKDIEIVSGWTAMGIPKLAYELADSMDLKTVGFSAKAAKEYDTYDVDEVIIKGDEFGDESEEFLDYIDCMIKVGGGPQSIEEYKTFTKNKVEYDL